MKMFSRIFLYLFTAIAMLGCASTKITSRQEYQGERIARPNNIIVYDFAATPDEVPGGSAMAGQYHATPQTQEQIAAGRRIGAQIATALVGEIRAMGLPAERATSQTQLQIGDLVLRGQLLSINEGSAVKRIAIGFGSGSAELKAAVEGDLVTERGLRKLGSGTTDSSGGKSPGAALGVAGTLATANPAGLIISTGMKVYGEASGKSKIEGRAEDLAKEIGQILQVKFQEQGWIY